MMAYLNDQSKVLWWDDHKYVQMATLLMAYLTHIFYL